MKKMMMAVICMAMVSMSCMAKNNGNMGHNNNGHVTKVEKDIRGGNGHNNNYKADEVIDMNAIHRLDLSRNEMKRVENLKMRCDKEMHRLYAKHDERMIRKTAERYEKELKGIIGRENYKRYEWLTGGNLAMNDGKHNPNANSNPNSNPNSNANSNANSNSNANHGGNDHRNGNVSITSIGRR